MDDVFGTGNGAISEPSDEELGIGEGGSTGIPSPDLPEGDDGGDDGGGVDAGDGEPAVGGAEHPQGRAFRAMRLKLEAQEREMAELRKDREQKIRFEERMRFLQEQQQQRLAQERAQREAAAARKLAEEDPMPDKEEDPIGFNEWRVRQLERRVEAEAAQRGQLAEQQVHAQRVAVINKIAGEYTTWEQRFQLERPDYAQAFAHVANWYAGFYRARGVPEERIAAALEDERARLIRDCLDIAPDGSGNYRWARNPAAIIYQTAHQLGYRAGGGQQPPQDDEDDEGVEMPAAAAPVRRPNAQRLERSVAAAGRSGTHGRAGAVSGGRMTLERFNNMPDAEAAKFMEEYPDLAQQLLSPHG